MLTVASQIFSLCPSLRPFLRTFSASKMAHTRSARANLSHVERTAHEPRDKSLRHVTLDEVTAINDTIRTFKFTIKEPTGINVPTHHTQT